LLSSASLQHQKAQLHRHFRNVKAVLVSIQRITPAFRKADDPEDITPCQWWREGFDSALPHWLSRSVSGWRMFAGSVCIHFIRESRPTASQGQPGSRALHLAACQETRQSWKNVWTLPSLWFKSCPGFCLGRCDTIYTNGWPAGTEWTGKHQQIFHPKAPEKRKLPGSRSSHLFKLPVTTIQAGERIFTGFRGWVLKHIFSFSSAFSQQDLFLFKSNLFLADSLNMFLYDAVATFM